MGSVSFALKCKLQTVKCLTLIGTEGRDLGAATALSMTNAFHIDRMRGEGDVQSWSMRNSTKPRPQQILLAAKLMEQNVELPISLGQIARELKTSVRQLHRVFRRHLQESPSEYYRAVRLTKARKLLRSTNKSVLDVSLTCGFASQSAFSRSYLRFFGHPPSKDRERNSLG
jgi:transcriptional regulator GlxA family with amidase domain